MFHYNAYQLHPKPYHVVNLTFHIINTLLVFCFIWLLLNQNWVAFITALLFAVHPMHVESVSWLSELKDLQYAMFYLMALCCYCIYIRTQKKVLYGLTLLLFLLSLLSKGMAASFPLVLLIIDYFYYAKINRKVTLNKIPFFLLAFVFGVIAILAQKHGQAIDTYDYNFFERVLFSSYGILAYLWKMILPINLICYYPYPQKTDGMFPVIFYLSPLIVGLLFVIGYKLKTWRTTLLFGGAFFLATIVLVLQILPVGSTIISDRYTYIPYIGVFYIIASIINPVIEGKEERYKSYRNVVILLFTFVLGWYSYLTFKRTKVWHDTITLWTDAIDKLKDDPIPYNNRAETYFWVGRYDEAIKDFTKAIDLDLEIGRAHV